MHMSLIVVGNGDLEEMMNPFWQDLEVEEYCVGEVSDYDKQRMMQYYSNKDGVNYRSFASCYQKHGQDWNFGQYRKDKDGVWREYSRSNPDMQWDWYEVGGRWPGRLRLKEGAEPILGLNFSWGWREDKNAMDKFIAEHPNCCDAALKGDVANLDELTSYAILKDGEWIELGDDEKVADYLKDVDDDTVLTCVDYHM